MNKTSIEWCNRPETRGADGAKTWNPIRARLKDRYATRRDGTFCTRTSPGCTNCYASVINKRFGNGLEFTVPNLEKVEFFIDERILEEPLKAKKPCTIFVGDMFDLFHEAISLQEGNDDPLTGPNVARVFDVMLRCPQHTFQLLTKRAENMRLWMECANNTEYRKDYAGVPFPPPNVWLGVSVESQKYADERIPLLLRTPAAVRFLSVEPMLEAVNLVRYLQCDCGVDPKHDQFAPPWAHSETCPYRARIHQVIVGGESGPGARPFNLAWAESLLKQCRAAGVPFFMKQIGSNPHDGDPAFCDEPFKLKNRKGGDMSEWPEDLRVREFPKVQKAKQVSVVGTRASS